MLKLSRGNIFRYSVSVMVISFFIYIFFKYFDFNEVIDNISQAKISLFLAALVVYYCSFITKTLRWKRLLGGIGIEEKFSYVFRSVFSSFFLNSLIPMRFGDLHRMKMLKDKRSVPITKIVGTLFIEKVIDVVILMTILLVSGFLLFQSKTPRSLLYVQILGLLLAIVLIAITVLSFFHKNKGLGIIPKRIANMLENFKSAVKNSLTLNTSIYILLISFIDWTLAFLSFYLVALSLGTKLSVVLVLFVVTLENLLSTIPITPAGLGFVESGIAGVLILVGYPSALSISIALLDRIVWYWSQIIFGLPAHFMFKKD